MARRRCLDAWREAAGREGKGEGKVPDHRDICLPSPSLSGGSKSVWNGRSSALPGVTMMPDVGDARVLVFSIPALLGVWRKLDTCVLGGTDGTQEPEARRWPGGRLGDGRKPYGGRGHGEALSRGASQPWEGSCGSMWWTEPGISAWGPSSAGTSWVGRETRAPW